MNPAALRRHLNRHLGRFLDVINKLGIPIIFLEPIYLEEMLNDEQKKQLFNYISYRSPKIVQKRLITFGMVANDAVIGAMQEANKKELKAFEPVEIFDAYDSQKNGTIEANLTTPLHCFYFLQSTIIQVTFLYKRNDFYWTGTATVAALNNILKGEIDPDEIVFGNYDMILELAFRPHKWLYRYDIFLPDDIVYYLGQLPTAEFIECNANLTKYVSLGHKVDDAEVADFSQNLKSGLIAMKSFMKRESMEFWLSGGTLLGWYRQCGVLPHSKDADFETWSQYASYDLEAKFHFAPEDFLLFYTFGYPDKAFEMAVEKSSLKLDLFFVYEINDTFAVTLHSFRKGWQWSHVPKFTLCSAELVGLKVLVSVDSDINLAFFAISKEVIFKD